MCKKRIFGLKLSPLLIILSMLLIGLLLPPEKLNANLWVYIGTFVGICTMGVFPSITLLVGCMQSLGTSKKEINELYISLKTSISNLLFIIYAALSVSASLAISILLVSIIHNQKCLSIIGRVRDSIIFVALFIILYIVFLLLNEIKNILKSKYNIAIQEADLESNRRKRELEEYLSKE